MARKAEIRVMVDKDFLDRLKQRVGADKYTELLQNALAVYDWATSEVEHDRVVVSAERSGGNLQRLFSPEFSRIKKQGGAA